MDYNDKSREELIEELEEANRELDSIRYSFHNNVTQLRQTEFQLGERRKELKCHNLISEFFYDSKISADIAVEKIVNILPDAMQFPELAEASIEIRGYLRRKDSKDHHCVLRKLLYQMVW
jgi:hypothetical protein